MATSKILIVEDESVVYEWMTITLKRMGYEILPPATTGVQAIESVKENAPDLIIMDISIGGDIDGIETANRIREISEAYVIYVSAHSDDNTFARAKLSGSYSYIVKPISASEFKTNIEMAIYKNQTERELKEFNRQLSQSEQRYRSIVDNIGIGIAVIGRGMKIVSLNRRMREWFPDIDISEKPLCYKSFNNPPRDCVCVYCPVILSFKDGAVHESTTETPAGEGVRNFRILASPLRDEIGSVYAVIELIEDITEQMDIQRRLLGQSEINSSMAEVSRALIQSDQISIEEISELILHHAKALTESAYGYVGYIDAETGFFVVPTLTTDVWDKCNVQDKRVVFEKLGGLVGWVLDNKESLLTNAPDRDHRRVGTPDGHIPITRLLSVPAMIGNKLLGQLSVANSMRDYTEVDNDVLLRLANYYALAIERKRIDDELKRHNQKLEAEVKRRTAELVTSNRLLEEEIIARKATEGKLKSKNIFSDLIIESVTDGLCVCHSVEQYPFVRFTVWNHRMSDITGYTMEEINHLGWYQSMYPDPRVQSRAIQRMAAMRYGDDLIAERWEVTCKDGEKKLFAISSSILYDVDGSAHVLALMQDITQSKRAEDDLRRAAYVIEQSPNMVVITDINVEIEYVNKMFTNITGYNANEVIGKNPRILKSGKTPPEVYTELWGRLTAGQQWQGEFCNRLKDGTEIWEFAKVFPLRDSDGNITNYLKMAEDITHKKRLEAELRQSQKMEAVGQLAGGVAHDFNNILSAIKNYAYLLKKRLKGDEKLLDFVDHIFSSTDKATYLTQSLLTFSRKQVINLKVVNLTDIITSTKKLFERLVREDIDLQVFVHVPEIMIHADIVQIEMVLINLVNNAMDAMSEGGALTIKADIISIDADFRARHNYGTVGKYARLVISDTGAGMDSATRDKIFDPFFTTKEVGKGTGLGLATVYGIIKQHNGYINVYSEPGSGSTFTILMPLIDSTKEEASPISIPGTAGGVETILLAEDNVEMRNSTRILLQEAGYQVIEATDGIDAMSKFDEHKFKIDLVLLDVVMPRANGKVVYDHIIKQTGGAARVIFLSGYSYEIIKKQDVLEQIGVYIQKPVRPDILLNKIREVLDQ
ncbi:PAS domain S-box protein [Candidatus Magnetobacterium casense]|uniref:histidine kinase n=1 Tax=Candidatus Magnetobacterium casense TaxID=1455061 RepID=A0ABS6RYQ4_9BACT|nr:PAS domain S-box protein [Candidatus Magnetobacterium casensis]MBV6341758.1 PAS domain S-box protein [Candidatus Magnetobacterium casensis]